MVSRKISLFGKMQRGRSPSFELFQLDMYVKSKLILKMVSVALLLKHENYQSETNEQIDR